MYGLAFCRGMERRLVHREGREGNTVWTQRLGAEEVSLVAFIFSKNRRSHQVRENWGGWCGMEFEPTCED